ncbi:MAG: hypothetical protein ACLS5K_03760 [Streptococcus salivarius]
MVSLPQLLPKFQSISGLVIEPLDANHPSSAQVELAKSLIADFPKDIVLITISSLITVKMVSWKSSGGDSLIHLHC